MQELREPGVDQLGDLGAPCTRQERGSVIVGRNDLDPLGIGAARIEVLGGLSRPGRVTETRDEQLRAADVREDPGTD